MTWVSQVGTKVSQTVKYPVTPLILVRIARKTMPRTFPEATFEMETAAGHLTIRSTVRSTSI